MSEIKYSIVIPTLNERDNITVLLSRLEKLFADKPGLFEVIVVDENSPDGTYEQVCEFARDRNFIRCEKNPSTPGLSQSIVYGFDIARGDFLCCMDGDLQHDETVLPELFTAAEEYDLVIGSRYAGNSGFAEKWNPIRKFGSKAVTLLTRMLLKTDVKDPMSGFFVIRRRAYENVRSRLNPQGFKIMLELLYMLNTAENDYSVKEVGIFFRNRAKGESKMSSKVVIELLKMLFDLRRRA
ncbi:MAG: polyprenol monophosphomannose synthase [Victivallaceae bacterium]|nr:polyprenol monophosphomannose synthase [Victivallaceae bacterium]